MKRLESLKKCSIPAIWRVLNTHRCPLDLIGLRLANLLTQQSDGGHENVLDERGHDRFARFRSHSGSSTWDMRRPLRWPSWNFMTRHI